MSDSDDEALWEVIRVVGPSMLWSSVKFGGFTGVLGLGLGGIAGLLRTTTPALFAAVSGVQCFTLGTTFWATRQAALISISRGKSVPIHDVELRERMQASSIAGGVSGAVTAAIFRGPKSVVPGMLMFSIFGCAGQAVFNAVDRRHGDSEQAGKTSQISNMVNSRFNPMKKLTDEEYKHMLQEKLIRVEAEIALIDEDLQKVKTIDK